MEIEFEREALFREIWQSPISTLAKRYGLSDTGLRKVCLALDLPLPGRGHWAKIAAGHAIATPTLAPTTGQTRMVCRPAIDESIGVQRPKDDPLLAERLAFEADPANEIAVAEVLLRPHPMVAAARRAVREEVAGLERSRKVRERLRTPAECVEPDWSVFARPSWRAYEDRGHIMELGEDVLPMLVSIETSSRALRIWDAVIKACTARGMQLEVQPRGLKVICDGNCVRLRVSEKVDRIPAPAGGPAYQRQVRIATGALRIFVIDRGGTKFEDLPERSLDHQLNDVLRRIHYSMASLRFQGHVWAEQRRLAEEARQAQALERSASTEMRQQREDDERRRAAAGEAFEIEQRAEIERERQLVIEADAWRQAETIRDYIAHVTSTITASGETAGPEDLVWLQWAAAAAEKLDPTSKRRR